MTLEKAIEVIKEMTANGKDPVDQIDLENVFPFATPIGNAVIVVLNAVAEGRIK